MSGVLVHITTVDGQRRTLRKIAHDEINYGAHEVILALSVEEIAAWRAIYPDRIRMEQVMPWRKIGVGSEEAAAWIAIRDVLPKAIYFNEIAFMRQYVTPEDVTPGVHPVCLATFRALPTLSRIPETVALAATAFRRRRLPVPWLS